jgi:hypothetical protein
MAVPEAAVHEYHPLPGRKNQIRDAGQIPTM